VCQEIAAAPDLEMASVDTGQRFARPVLVREREIGCRPYAKRADGGARPVPSEARKQVLLRQLTRMHR
jgi:hypothetical protein